MFFKYFFPRPHIHKEILNSFSTNLHPLFFQLNFNLIQLNVNPTIELNLVELEFYSMCLNLI